MDSYFGTFKSVSAFKFNMKRKLVNDCIDLLNITVNKFLGSLKKISIFLFIYFCYLSIFFIYLLLFLFSLLLPSYLLITY